MSINEKVLEIIEEVPEGHFLFVENIETGESSWTEDAAEYFGFSDCTILTQKRKCRRWHILRIEKIYNRNLMLFVLRKKRHFT